MANKNALALAPEILDTVKAAQRKFSTIAKRSGGVVNWPTESQFAMQAIAKTPLLQKCVPQSIIDAIINVAAIGLSLNPQRKHIALIPRYDTKLGANVCHADPMYQGLISLATETDSIAAVNCDVVRERDVAMGNFKYISGTTPHVLFSPDPFMSTKDRGPIVGCFLVTDVRGASMKQTTWMRIEEIYEIRDKYSEAWKYKLKIERSNENGYQNGGPWDVGSRHDVRVDTEPEEMIKKTVIKRASKTWPKRTERMDYALQASNDAEGIRIEPRDTDIEGELDTKPITKSMLSQIEVLVQESHVNPAKILKRFSIGNLADLPRHSFSQCTDLLRESKLSYILKNATAETTVYADEWGISYEALEGKAADQQSKAKLSAKKPAEEAK